MEVGGRRLQEKFSDNYVEFRTGLCYNEKGIVYYRTITIWRRLWRKIRRLSYGQL